MSKNANIFDLFKEASLHLLIIIIGLIILFVIPYAVYWVISNTIDTQTDISLEQNQKILLFILIATIYIISLILLF